MTEAHFLQLVEPDGTVFVIREDLIRIVRPCDREEHAEPTMVVMFDWFDAQGQPSVNEMHAKWNADLMGALPAPHKHEALTKIDKAIPVKLGKGRRK